MGMWMVMSFFIYLHSKQYSNAYVGFLLAYFSAQGMGVPCSADEDPNALKENLYETILSVVIAMFITVFFDLVFTRRASLHAAEAMDEAWDTTRKATDRLFSQGEESLDISGGSIAHLIGTAEKIS